MKASTFSLVVTLFATIASIHGAHGTAIKGDISELTSFEKLLLRTTHPEVFARGSRNTPGVTAGWEDYTVVDFLNIDLPTLALQLSKSQDTIKLPSLYYEFGWYWCWIGECVGFLQKYDFSGPEIRNANLTRLNTKINATNIELDFEIPDLQLIIENFTLDDEDLVTGERKFWRGASIFIRNYTLQLSANLGLVPDIGIQVSNVSMSFGVGDFRLRYENATHTLPDGIDEEWGETETSFTEQLNNDWVDAELEVTTFAELWLNCFLSNGESSTDAECDTLVNDNKMQTENFIQLLQNIGLGIAQSQQNSVKHPNRNAVVANPKFHLLPQFPTPEIDSIFLELSTFLLQFGKIFGVPEFLYLPFEGYPLSYDFTWENCTLEGVCQNIREQMILPTFMFGGFENNRAQLDFKPNSFSYSFKVPSLSFVSSTYQYEISILETRYKEVCLGLELAVTNTSFGITGNYEFKEGVGIQVSNLGLTLRLGELKLRAPEFYTVENGVQSPIEEYEVDIGPQIMERWAEVDEDGVVFERKYEEYVQNVINSVLSDGQGQFPSIP